jgi:Protein of unknown function (DUF3768)
VSAENIRALNATFGTAMTGGRVFMTAGVDAPSSDVKATVIQATFTEFTPDNDPHGEHDFGNFGLRVLTQRGRKFGQLHAAGRDLSAVPWRLQRPQCAQPSRQIQRLDDRNRQTRRRDDWLLSPPAPMGCRTHPGMAQSKPSPGKGLRSFDRERYNLDFTSPPFNSS